VQSLLVPATGCRYIGASGLRTTTVDDSKKCGSWSTTERLDVRLKRAGADSALSRATGPPPAASPGCGAELLEQLNLLMRRASVYTMRTGDRRKPSGSLFVA